MICGGFTPLNPLAFGGTLFLSPSLLLLESAKSSPKITRALAGRFFSADGQSVAAGCCAAGTPSIQIRHMPFGGRASAGMEAFFLFVSFDACCAHVRAGAAAATIPKT